MDKCRITDRITLYMTHPVVHFIVRCILGSIFIIAALSKVNAVDEFTQTILNYRILSPLIATVVATVLPWIELLCGVSLLLGIFQRSSAFILSTLLIVFTILIVRALYLGLSITCGCFSQDPSSNTLGWWKVLENSVYIALAVYLLLCPEDQFTIFSLFDKRNIQLPRANDHY
ncbi:MAG: DoxX family membrane protein [Bacteroidetes bacterium]|nr:DoxX family membrane protein [Bacteroidota bacterium]